MMNTLKSARILTPLAGIATLLLAVAVQAQDAYRWVDEETGETIYSPTAPSNPHMDYTLLANGVVIGTVKGSENITPEFLGANPDRPFSDAVRVGHMLYLSGKLGNLPGTTDLVEGGIQPETRQTMENIKASLERHGSSLDRVVKCTVFLADIDEWAAMNEVYVTYFPVNRPARSALGASGLALDARVEIECIATIDQREARLARE